MGESCPVKACMSYVVGGAMGAFMGLFQVILPKVLVTEGPLLDQLFRENFCLR